MVNEIRKEELMKLARELLNETGQNDVEQLLEDGNEQDATAYLLGAIDKAFANGRDAEVLAGYYKILGVSPEEASSLRQQSGKL